MEENKYTETKPDTFNQDTPEEDQPTETPFDDQKPASEPKEQDINEIKLTFFKKIQFWQITSILFIVLFVISLFFVSGSGESISQTEAKNRVQDYVDTVISGRAVAIIGDINEEKGLYKVGLNIQGQDIDSYITKDGEVFFPTGVVLDTIFDSLIPITGGAAAGNIELDMPDSELEETEIIEDGESEDLEDDEEETEDDEEGEDGEEDGSEEEE
ncbi:MAG: hypothetical protein ABIB47_00120 [Candidatus Woesearchaeota archaeon]